MISRTISRCIPAMAVAAALACATSARAATLYWDINGATAGFGGSGGTWGTDAFWTTDGTGGFAGGGVVATTGSDPLHVNNDPVTFSMGVSGDVHAYNFVGVQNKSDPTTINGPGTVHLHASGSANPLIGGNNDLGFTLSANLVIEASGGSDVYLANQGGNNSAITIDGSITSTNTVNLYYADPGNFTLNGDIDLKGGSFKSISGGGHQIRNPTVNGVIGSGVHHVDRSGPQGGHASNKGKLTLANPNNAYTGDTILDQSIIRITTDTSLPDTTRIFISNGGLFQLDNPGTDTVAGLYFDGVEQAAGLWGSSSSSATNTNDTFFTGSGMINVVSTAPIPAPAALPAGLALMGVLLAGRRRV